MENMSRLSLTSIKEDDNDSSQGFFDSEGIRFSPKMLEFYDVFEGEKRDMEFSLQNVGGKPLQIHLEPPTSLAFTLLQCDPELVLAPGLILYNTLSFTHYRKNALHSSIRVRVGNNTVDYKIRVHVATTKLVVTPSELDFGNIDMDSPAIIRFLTLHNKGSLGTKFGIDVGTDELEMNVMPLKGILRAKSEVKVRFELVGLIEGEHCKEIWIKCQKIQPLRVLVRVRVIQPQFMVHHPKTTGDFTLIDFPITYFNAQRHEVMVVRNISGLTCMFVILAEVNNELMGLKKARNTIPDFGMFTIEPSEGRLESFEGRVFTLNFCPTYDMGKERRSRYKKESKDFLVFLRIMRIQSSECVKNEDVNPCQSADLCPTIEREQGQIANLDMPSVGVSSHMKLLKKNSLSQPPTSQVHVARLCLHGEALSPEICFLPTMMDLGIVSFGTTHVRVLRITNLCTSLPMNFKYCKAPFIEMSPSCGEIGAGKALEVIIKVAVHAYGSHCQKIKVDILGRSSPMLQDSTLVKLGYYKFSVKFICEGKAILPAPVFNMGITPMVTNEVGKLTDGMKFGSANLVPEAAMVSADVCKRRPWMKKKTLVEKYKFSTGKKRPSDTNVLSATEVSVGVESKELLCDCKAVVTLFSKKQSTVPVDVSCNDVSCEPCSFTESQGAAVDVTIKKCVKYSSASPDKWDAIFPEQMTKKITRDGSCGRSLPNSQSMYESKNISGQDFTKHAKTENVHDLDENISVVSSARILNFIYSSSSIDATPGALSEKRFSVLGVSKNADNISHFSDDKTLSISTNSVRDEIILKPLYSPDISVCRSSSQKLVNKHIIVSSYFDEELKSDSKRHKGQYSANIKMNKVTPLLNSSTNQMKTFDQSRNPTMIEGTQDSVNNVSNKPEHLTTIYQKVKSSYNSPKKIQNPMITITKASLYAKKPFITARTVSSVPEIHAISNRNLKFPNLASSQKLLSKELIAEIEKDLASAESQKTKPQVSSKYNFQLAEKVLLPELENELPSVSHKKVYNTETTSFNKRKLSLSHKIRQKSPNVQQRNIAMPIKSKSILKSEYEGGKNQNVLSTKPKTKKKRRKKPIVVIETPSSLSLFSQVSCQELLPKVAVQPVALPDRCARVRQCAKHLYMLEVAGSGEPQDALIALPNDRAQSLRPWPTGKITRTIFTGVPRYAAPVDCDYAFTPKEERAHQQHADHYLSYMRTVARRLQPQDAPSMPEYQIAESTLYEMMGMCQPQVVPKQGILPQECAARLQSKTSPLVQVLLPLTPLQIYNIKIYPKNIHFGKVAPNSNSVEYFRFENLNPFPVKISMIPGRSGVSAPQGDNRILMPHQREEILMMYNAEHLGRYNGYMDYIINDNHSFMVSVTAEVVPKSIKVISNTLIWGTESLDNAFPLYTHFVTISNPLQAYCRFTWGKHIENYPFYITPESGTVPPNRELLCEVSYHPKFSSPIYQEIIIHSESGTLDHLYCKKMKHKPTVFFVNSQLDMHQIPLNLPRVFHSIIFNANYEDKVFMVTNSNPMVGCLVSPSTGIIHARSCLILELRMKVNQAVDINFTLFVDIQQQLTLELKVIGSVEYPKVLIKPEVMHIRRIRADSTDSMLVTFENLGTVEAIIQINMSDFPEFQLSATARKVTPAFGENGFEVLPKECKDIYIIFNPTDVATYEFYLPIIINGLLGPPNIERPYTTKTEFYLTKCRRSMKECRFFPSHLPLVRLDCTVAGHILTLSTHHFNLVLLPGNTQHSKTTDEVRVTNMHHTSVMYCIILKEILVPSSPFLLQYKAGRSTEMLDSMIIGTLDPGEHTIFEVTFVPKETGFFNAETPIYVHGNDECAVFNYIYFRGLHPAPILKSEVSQIVFAPIPLCVPSKQTIYLEAYHHRNNSNVFGTIKEVYDEEVKCNLSETLTLIFLNGRTIHGMTGVVSLGVLVTFSSERPVSFRTEIVFQDDTGSECNISVIATADNCLLTTHAFLRTRSDKYKLVEVGVSREASSMDVSPPIKEPNADRVEGQSLHDSEGQSSMSEHAAVEISTMQPAPLSVYNEMTTPILIVNSSNSSSALAAGNLNYSSISMIDDDSENGSKGTKDSSSIYSNPVGGQTLAFPLYPSVDDDTDYTYHMDRTIMAAERWLYEQGFQCSFGAEIPRGLTAMMAGYYTPSKKPSLRRTNPFEMKTILDVLVNLAGPHILKYFNLRPMPEETEERVQYQLAQHILLLKLLKKQGACLAHVKPSYLLNYADYLVHIDCKKKYRVNKYNEPNTYRNEKQMGGKNQEHRTPDKQSSESSAYGSLLTEEKFNRLGKQAWLDVVLQIAKTLHLNRVTADGARYNRRKSSTISPLDISSNKSNLIKMNDSDVLNSTLRLYEQMDPLESNVYSTSERILLAWLNTVFNQYQYLLWNSSKHPPARTIVNFDYDLADGLVLAVVTCTYCPYLVKEFFSDLYKPPNTLEQAYHNAGRLITAWRTVHLGFTVYVEDIVRPNVVLLLLLVKHLYSQLPNLYPRLTLRFNTPLATEVTRSILFENPSNKRVVFKAKFIGDPFNFFAVTNPGMTIYIKAHEKVNIGITYTARKIARVTATLILCGCVIAPHFARSHAFNLQGDPSSLRVTTTFNLSAPLYRPTSLTLPIYPPFPVNAEYDIMCTETEPRDASTFHPVPWRELCLRKVPRRLFLNKSCLQVLDSQTATPLNLTLACLTPITRVFWLTFMHPDVGDFIIKLVVAPKRKQVLEKLITQFPPDWQTVDCKCVHPKRGGGMASTPCDLQTVISIPCRNAFLWKAIETMFEKTLDSREKEFWNKHFETNIGLRLIQWMLGSENDSVSQEFKHIFNVAVMYNVTCSHPIFVRTAEQISIPDVRLNTTVDLPIHVSNQMPPMFTVQITLTSVDCMEIRYYQVVFEPPPKPPLQPSENSSTILSQWKTMHLSTDESSDEELTDLEEYIPP